MGIAGAGVSIPICYLSLELFSSLFAAHVPQALSLSLDLRVYISVSYRYLRVRSNYETIIIHFSEDEDSRNKVTYYLDTHLHAYLLALPVLILAFHPSYSSLFFSFLLDRAYKRN